MARTGGAGVPRRVVALHIDYGNRPESAAEAEYVAAWCAAQGNVEFRVRTIHEVRRGVTAREDYERESRRIRYAFYAEQLAETRAAGVLVGHHRGDVQENILTNVMRVRSPSFATLARGSECRPWLEEGS